MNGLQTSEFPTTGALLYDASGIEAAAGTDCTGTLIGCQTFLTAAHCFASEEPYFVDLEPSHYFVLLQNAGFFAIESIAISPDYATVVNATVESWGDELADIAVVKLSDPVTAITPQPLLTSDPFTLFASGGTYPGTIAGFGITHGDAWDIGLKRWGRVEAEACPASELGPPAADERVLCWEFADPIGPAGDDSNTCMGDSGGPLFFTVDGTEAVAGVTQAGLNESCEPEEGEPDLSWDTSVYYYLDFVETELGDDATAACGDIAAVGSAGASVTPYSDTLGALGETEVSFDVASGTRQLRVALNGLDDGIFDPVLYVGYGAPATAGAYDCKDTRSSPNGYCEIANPETGTWFVGIENRGWGAGDYQLTVTRLPEPGRAIAGLAALGVVSVLGAVRRRRGR